MKVSAARGFALCRFFFEELVAHSYRSSQRQAQLEIARNTAELSVIDRDDKRHRFEIYRVDVSPSIEDPIPFANFVIQHLVVMLIQTSSTPRYNHIRATTYVGYGYNLGSVSANDILPVGKTQAYQSLLDSSMCGLSVCRRNLLPRICSICDTQPLLGFARILRDWKHRPYPDFNPASTFITCPEPYRTLYM